MGNYDSELEEQKKEVKQKKEISRKLFIRNILSSLLILAGVTIIVIPIIGRYLANNTQKDMLDEFYTSLEASSAQEIEMDLDALDEALVWGAEDINQEEMDTNYTVVTEETGEDQLTDVTNLSVMPSTIGVIKISVIDLEYPIGEGTDLDTLRFVIGHVPESAPINEIGNAVMAGHRSHSFGSFFNRLDEVVYGDEIIITSFDGNIVTYKVFEKVIIDADDYSVMKGSSKYRVITLITCHPLYQPNPPNRLIIHAIDITQWEDAGL